MHGFGDSRGQVQLRPWGPLATNLNMDEDLGAFDFIKDIPPYNESARSIRRLNKRHQLLIEPYVDEIAGARVLDLGAHDGRWAYALARAGAAEVVGIEARQHLIDNFAKLPAVSWTRRVKLRQGDMFDVLEQMLETGEEFDLVAAYGIFYHIMDHLRLLKLIHLLGPKAIFIDSEFSLKSPALIDMVFERTEMKVNAAPQIPGQEKAIIGIPTQKAMVFMARALGYEVIWPGAEDVFGDDRAGVDDYFRTEVKRRRFCILVPEAAAA